MKLLPPLLLALALGPAQAQTPPAPAPAASAPHHNYTAAIRAARVRGLAEQMNLSTETLKQSCRFGQLRLGL